MRRIERSGETILVETSEDSTEEVLAVFHNHKININSFKVSKFENNTAEIEIVIIRAQHVPQLINDLSKIPTVKHVEY